MSIKQDDIIEALSEMLNERVMAVIDTSPTADLDYIELRYENVIVKIFIQHTGYHITTPELTERDK